MVPNQGPRLGAGAADRGKQVQTSLGKAPRRGGEARRGRGADPLNSGLRARAMNERDEIGRTANRLVEVTCQALGGAHGRDVRVRRRLPSKRENTESLEDSRNPVLEVDRPSLRQAQEQSRLEGVRMPSFLTLVLIFLKDLLHRVIRLANLRRSMVSRGGSGLRRTAATGDQADFSQQDGEEQDATHRNRRSSETREVEIDPSKNAPLQNRFVLKRAPRKKQQSQTLVRV